MGSISDDEKARRKRVNASVIGTSAMEGVTLDRETLDMMRRFEQGELTRDQLSAGIDAHVEKLLATRNRLTEQILSEVGAA
jgi:hypothetical protein